MKGSSASVMGEEYKWMKNECGFRGSFQVVAFGPQKCTLERKKKHIPLLVGLKVITAALVFFFFVFFLPCLHCSCPIYRMWADIVLCIISRGNFTRMHYLPLPKLVLSPLPQDLLLFVSACLCVCVCVCVCVRLIRNWAEYLGRPERFIILMNTIQRGRDTVLG